MSLEAFLWSMFAIACGALVRGLIYRQIRRLDRRRP